MIDTLKFFNCNKNVIKYKLNERVGFVQLHNIILQLMIMIFILHDFSEVMRMVTSFGQTASAADWVISWLWAGTPTAS